MPNPLIQQGTLNRLKVSVIVNNIPTLNITPPYMGKSYVTVSFDGDFDNLIPTATGAVTSPEPYVTATVTVPLLRSQALSGNWLTQAGTTSDIGNISIFPDVDTANFPEIDLVNCIIKHIDPGAFDGTDPIVSVTLQGVYNVNNALWTA